MTFRTSSRVTLTLPKNVKVPAMSVCFCYTDILDIALFNEKYNTSIIDPLDIHEKKKIQSIITIGDMFDLTPGGKLHATHNNNSILFDSCLVRSHQDYSHEEYPSEKCHEIFDVNKFQIMEYICYRFILPPDYKNPNSSLDRRNIEDSERGDIKFNFDRLSFSLSYPDLFFEIHLSTKKEMFDNADVIRVVIHTPQDYPFISLSLAPIGYRLAKNKNGKRTPRDNAFFATYGLIEVFKLESPYDTHCLMKSYDEFLKKTTTYNDNGCQNECLNYRLVEKLGKPPFVIITTEDEVSNSNSSKSHLQPISPEELKNLTTKVIVKEIDEECIEKCRYPSCHLDFTLTSVREARGEKDSIDFTLTTPENPQLVILYSAQTTFNDYLLMSLSLLEFWLGMPVYALNPTRLIEVLVQKFRKRNKVTSKPNIIVKEIIDHECIRTRQLLNKHLRDEIAGLITFLTKR